MVSDVASDPATTTQQQHQQQHQLQQQQREHQPKLHQQPQHTNALGGFGCAGLFLDEAQDQADGSTALAAAIPGNAAIPQRSDPTAVADDSADEDVHVEVGRHEQPTIQQSGRLGDDEDDDDIEATMAKKLGRPTAQFAKASEPHVAKATTAGTTAARLEKCHQKTALSDDDGEEDDIFGRNAVGSLGFGSSLRMSKPRASGSMRIGAASTGARSTARSVQKYDDSDDDGVEAAFAQSMHDPNVSAASDEHHADDPKDDTPSASSKPLPPWHAKGNTFAPAAVTQEDDDDDDYNDEDIDKILARAIG